MTDRPAYVVVDDVVDGATTDRLARLIEDYVAAHDLAVIERHDGRRPLRYQVIDGDHVRRGLPALVALFADVQTVVERLMRASVVPMRNTVAQLNVNITPPGGSYRWHYDRNEVTALLYLNQVDGGELELCPNYRLGAGRRATNRAADRVLRTPALRRAFGHAVTIAPKPGRLVMMRGKRCLHSVRPVTGATDRINVVMSFDLADACGAEPDDLDTYLYTQRPTRGGDPNYR